MTLYVDSLFLMNFFMDTMILFAVAVLRRRRERLGRIFLSATLSALYGALMFFPSLSFLYGAILKIIFSAIIVAIAFGAEGVRDFLSSFGAFWLATLVCGGIVLAISVFTDFGLAMQTAVSNCIMYVNLNPFALLISCGVLYLLIELHRRLCIRSFSREKILLKLNVGYMGRVCRLTALIDTGCELTEPIRSTPMLVAEKKMFKGISPPNEFVYVNTATGVGRLQIISPDFIECDDRRYSIKNGTMIALSDTSFTYDGLYNSIINPDATVETELCYKSQNMIKLRC